MGTKQLAKRGPKTAVGKITASMNSTKHGITSPKPVVTHYESETAWQRHRDSILEATEPQNGLEQALAERIAFNSWRLNRVVAYETAQLAAAQDDIVPEMLQDAERYSYLGTEDKRGFEAVERAGKLRAIHDDLKTIYPEVKGELASQHTAHWLYEEAPYHAAFVAADQADPDFDEDEEYRELSRLSDRLETAFRARLGDATLPDTAALADALTALAEEAGIKDDEHYTAYESLMEKVFTEIEALLEWDEKKAEELERKIASKRRRAVIPDLSTIQLVSRYEAHLSREMYKAIHELEALQRRRAGEVMPLARLEVQGLPES
jgi:hypothetical protein